MTTQSQLPIVFIACRVFEKLLEDYVPSELADKITFLDFGLHETPRNLKKTVQEHIDLIEEPSLVVLGYGLCGNGLHGIKAGKHTLLVPRTDDCIAILYGSYEAYREQFDAAPGTYYLTKGWLESGSNPLDQYLTYVEKYGESQAQWLMDEQYKHYIRLVFVAHRQEDLDSYRPKAMEIARFCERWGMRYEELRGSDQYVRRLAQVAMDLDKADSDFLIVRPGEMIDQSQFIR